MRFRLWLMIMFIDTLTNAEFNELMTYRRMYILNSRKPIINYSELPIKSGNYLVKTSDGTWVTLECLVNNFDGVAWYNVDYGYNVGFDRDIIHNGQHKNTFVSYRPIPEFVFVDTSKFFRRHMIAAMA